MIYQIAQFSMTIFNDLEYSRNGTRYRHSFNGVLIGTYARLIVNSVISNDLSDLE